MAKKESVLWPIEPHTVAKHRILRGYLDAYFPILSRGQREAVRYIDAFAGPGSYVGGEDGSPIVAMRSAIEHKYDFPKIEMHFIEANAERQAALRTRVDQIASQGVARNVIVRSIDNATCEEGVDRLLKPYERRGRSFGPALFFLDQFGYADVPMNLIERIMRNRDPNCEVFSYLHVPGLKRFLTDDVKDATRSSVFGDETWREALSVPVGRRLPKLVELYRAALKKHARPEYVWHFLMADENDEPIYWLFFCTHHPLGLSEMKKSMKRVDPTLRYRFSDRDQGKQVDLLAADDAWLEDHLARTFSGQALKLGEIEHYVLEHTPLWACRQLLKSMRKKGMVSGGTSKSIGDDDTVLTFTPYQAALI